MKVARVALEVEQLMADYPSMVNSSKWLPKAKHHMEHIIETKCTHPVQAHYRRLDKDKLEAAKAEFMAIGQQGIVMLSKSTWSSPLYMVRRMMACSG